MSEEWRKEFRKYASFHFHEEKQKVIEDAFEVAWSIQQSKIDYWGNKFSDVSKKLEIAREALEYYEKADFQWEDLDEVWVEDDWAQLGTKAKYALERIK